MGDEIDVVDALRMALRAHGPLPVHKRIAIERELAELSQRHCARAMNWSHTLWQQVEEGIRRVTREEEKRIAKIVGCSVQRLRGEQPQATPGWKKQGRPRREHLVAA